MKWVPLTQEEIERYALREGDILVVRTNGNPEYVGRCLVVPVLSEETVFASYLIRLSVDVASALPEYVATVLNSSSVRRRLRAYVRSSAGNFNINTKGLRSVVVPMPSLGEQKDFLERYSSIRKAVLSCRARVDSVSELQRGLLRRSMQQ